MTSPRGGESWVMNGDRLTGFPLMVSLAFSGWPKTTAAVEPEGNSTRCPGSTLILVFSPLFFTICTQVETCISSTPSEAAAEVATADAAVLAPVVANGACAAAFGAGLVGACGAVVDGAAAAADGAGVLVDAANVLVDGAGVPLLGVASESVGLFSLEAALLAADSFAVGAGTVAGSRLSFSTPIVIRPAMAKATHPHGNVLDSRSLGGSEISIVLGSGAVAVNAIDDTSDACGASASAVSAVVTSAAVTSAVVTSDFGVPCAIASDTFAAGGSATGTSATGGSRAGSATPK